MNKTPQALIGFNLYKGTENKLIGIANITLPEAAMMTVTMSGAGIAGEINVPVIGNFESMQTEIATQVLYDTNFSLLALNGELLTARGSLQVQNPSTGGLETAKLRVIIGGFPAGLNLGNLAPASVMDSSNTLEVYYLKIFVNDEEKLEIDKPNYTYRVNGVDLFEDASKGM